MKILPELRKQILDHLKTCLPEEGCGILGGTTEVSTTAFMITNDLHSPTSFQMNPQEQLQAFLRLEDMGLEMTAIFHSHPCGPQFPSQTDVEAFAYPGAISLICVPLEGVWVIRGFDIMDKKVTEITLTWD
ncbi:MAG TPA: M67 family metallopeptidase [Longilinea sp.]|nr:M67 family metallopeptidase [Longilinea sp.]